MSLPSKIWEIKSTATAGFGVFAKAPIPRGTRIFSERPLLFLQPGQCPSAIYPSSLLLPANDQKWLMSLSTASRADSTIIRLSKVIFWSFQRLSGSKITRSSWKNYRRWSILENLAVLNIFRNNCFDLQTPKIGQALFKRISRLNHSCIPNAQGNYHPLNETFNVHATSDIASGDEITLSYLPEKCQTRNQRVEALNSGYGFQCACPACNLGLEQGQAGEKRRVNMQNIFETVSEGGHVEDTQKAYLQRVQDLKWDDGKDGTVSTMDSTNLRMMEKFVWTLEKGGVAGREVASLYMEIARLYVKEGRHEVALQNAEKGLLLDEACLGTDHPIYQESLAVVQSLRHCVWVTRISS